MKKAHFFVCILAFCLLFFIIKSFFYKNYYKSEWRGSTLYFTEISNEKECYKAGGWSTINWPLNTVFTCIVSNKKICEKNDGQLRMTGDFISCIK